MNKFEYKNLTPFKWFVLENFPFIEADFDALTEWQIFCKLGKEINKIIDSQNIVGEQAENLTNAFNNLKNYVDNYFDNLDVQDEINNKLNEMAKDGTLQEIISAYLNSKAVFGFDNVEEMKNSINLTDGSYAQTLGYYSKNDGGGAVYKIRKITNQDTINNINILPISNNDNLIAELIIDEVIGEKFGLHGDGTTDDTNIMQFIIDNYNNIILNKDYKVSNIYIKASKNININVLRGNIIIQSSDINLNFKTLYGNITFDDSLGLIQLCNIKGTRIINTQGNGITLNGISGGIQYNNFEISLIRANKCIYFNKTGSWINSNYFKKTNLSYNIGIDSVPSSDYDGNVFDEIGFEDINKWFNLNDFKNTLFTKCRMIPFEAHSTEIPSTTKLGTIQNAYNILFDGNTNGIWYKYIQTNRNININNPNNDGGTKVGNYAVFNGTNLVSLKQDCFRNPFYKLSDLSSSLQINLGSCNITKPIEILLDTNKYLYININSADDFKDDITNIAIPYIDFKFIGSQTLTIDIAYKNIVKHTVRENTENDTFRYYFGS